MTARQPTVSRDRQLTDLLRRRASLFPASQAVGAEAKIGQRAAFHDRARHRRCLLCRRWLLIISAAPTCGDSRLAEAKFYNGTAHIYHDRRRSYCSSLRSRCGLRVTAGERIHGERAPTTSTTGAWHQLSGHHAHDGADVNPPDFPAARSSTELRWCRCRWQQSTCSGPQTAPCHGDQFICRNTAGVGIIDQQAALLIHTNIVITQGFNWVNTSDRLTFPLRCLNVRAASL